MAGRWPSNKFSIANPFLFCQQFFVHKNGFLYFARLKLVDFIQHSDLKKKKCCAILLLQREMPKNNSQMAVKKPEIADNVKVCILHVMNMDHAEKKTKHMQQKNNGEKQTMDVSIFE